MFREYVKGHPQEQLRPLKMVGLGGGTYRVNSKCEILPLSRDFVLEIW